MRRPIRVPESEPAVPQCACVGEPGGSLFVLANARHEHDVVRRRQPPLAELRAAANGYGNTLTKPNIPLMKCGSTPQIAR